MILSFILEFKRCTKQLDIAILIESSGSIGEKNYIKQKTFVKNFAGAFRISEQWTRVGIIVYSDRAFVAKRFNENFEHEYLSGIINDLPFRKGTGNINNALRLAADNLLTTKTGMREGVPRIVIVITDGRHNMSHHQAYQLRGATEHLVSVGARIFVVGVGQEVNENSLALISGNRENVMVSRSFDHLPKQEIRLARMSCKAEGMLRIGKSFRKL